MNFRVRKRREPQVIIVSLIDVVLQLVIFLLLTTTFKGGGAAIDVSLPSAESDLRPPGRGLVLDLDRDGNVSVAGRNVGAEGVGEALRREVEDHEPPEVVIRADRRVSHGDVVDLMDLARRHDIHRLAVAAVVMPEGSAPPGPSGDETAKGREGSRQP
jgi:biopolymer transport protein ExbD